MTPILPTGEPENPGLDPALAATTVLALGLHTPAEELEGAQRIDLAIAVQRFTGWSRTPVGELHCALDADMDPELVAQRSRLPVELVRGQSPARIALTVLDRYLNDPPYLLVTGSGDRFKALIDGHAGDLPALAGTPVLEIADLARRVLPDIGDYGLEHLAVQLGASGNGPLPPALGQAHLIALLYARLLTLLRARAGGPVTLADLAGAPAGGHAERLARQGAGG